MADENKPDGIGGEAKAGDEPAQPVASAMPDGAAAPAEAHPASEQPHEAPHEETERRFFVAGIGASAGGVEAIGELIKHVPAHRMAFIVVQHLARDHESILPQLIARNTTLPVLTAKDGMRLDPGRIYVTPPNCDLAILHGAIRVITPPASYGARLPIDYLFRSLAEDLGQDAIGIVMSGTGTDGTLGLEAIKAAGGFTFVQDPSTARYDGMPRSALTTGAADYSLPPKAIGEELERISKQPKPVRVPAIPPHVQDQLSKIFVLIRSEFGNDLSYYKSTTIERRLERRMTMSRITNVDEYVRYVQSNRDELKALYKDMLITVTSFFRDPEAFDAVKALVFPQLLERKDPDQPIRVWVPACATGEEAYSLAMSLVEFCEQKVRNERIQIFATDVDEDCIQHARRGMYPPNIALDVSPGRINRFFTTKGNEYQVTRRLRDMLVFSRQNLLKDAPFSRMDLVSCRNLLIYLQPAAQRKVLRILHYALNPVGYLFLGSSETVGDAPELFAAIDRKNKIYAKKHVAVPAALDATFVPPAGPEMPRVPVVPRPPTSLQATIERKVLDLYGPPGVVINEELEIVSFRGHMGPYVDPAAGAASFNLMRVVRFELHIELRRAIQQAIAEKQRVTTDVTLPGDGKHIVSIDVVPLSDPDTNARYLLVLFQKQPPPKEVPVATSGQEQGAAAGALMQRIHDLEHELASTKVYLQATTEEKESAFEELKAANEELQSSNEELQSTNEELETSKEEMQSTNEELTTVNEELQNRMTELSQTNDDLHNVLTGVDNVVVILGMDLRIRRYTASAERLFHLVPGDIGRPVAFLDSFLQGAALEQKATSVIQNLSTVEEEVLAGNRRWYAVRISPYKTLDHTIRGAVIILSDIDVRKRAEEMTSDVSAYAGRFLAAISHPLLVVDRRLRIVWANDAFLSTFQLTSEETLGSTLGSVGERQFSDSQLREQMENVFNKGTMFRRHEVRLSFPEGGERTVHLGGSLLPVSTETPSALLSIEPVG